MRIAIIGCGWVGEKLAAYLSKKGVHVIATTTTPEKIIPLEKIAEEAHLLDFTDHPDFSVLQSVDVAIFSMPISDPSWLEGFKSLNTEFPKTMLFSSTGIYPQQPGTYTEEDDANLRSDILAAESLVRSSYPQTNILRFGGLMGGDRSPKKLFARRTLVRWHWYRELEAHCASNRLYQQSKFPRTARRTPHVRTHSV